MKYYIDCVSGYSHLNNSELLDELGEGSSIGIIYKKFRNCFTKGSVKSECGRNIIELQILLINICDVMIIIEKSEVRYSKLRKILALTLSGIAEISGNCANDSNNFKPEKP